MPAFFLHLQIMLINPVQLLTNYFKRGENFLRWINKEKHLSAYRFIRILLKHFLTIESHLIMLVIIHNKSIYDTGTKKHTQPIYTPQVLNPKFLHKAFSNYGKQTTIDCFLFIKWHYFGIYAPTITFID